MSHLSSVRSRLTVLAAAIVVSLTACGGIDSPSDVVEEWAAAVSAGEISHAISLFDPAVVEAIGESEMREEFREAFEDLNSANPMSIEVKGEEIRGDLATVTTHLVHPDGSVDETDIELVLVDGAWRLSF